MRCGMIALVMMGVAILGPWVLSSVILAEEGMNNIKIADVNVEKALITEIVGKLVRTYQISICVEEELKRKQKLTFTFRLNQATLEAVLNKITTVDPDYTWERDEVTEIVNIYPKENAPLGWEIKNLVFKDKTFREIFISNDLLGLKEHSIIFSPERGNLAWLDTRASLNASSIIARQALNQLCKQLKFKARWELVDLPSWNSNFKAKLMFQGYGINPVRE